MAFPVGWGRRCALVIQSNKVDANQSDFPVLLTKDTLPSEMFDHDGSYPALEGGGDIRFSSDEAGNTQLACEIVSFSLDNANNEAEIWVKIPSVATGNDTIFYIWYNKTGETQPAIDSTYGAENVWDSNFKMVQHMEDTTTSTITDSTSNDNDGAKKGANEPIEADGKIGKGQDFDGVDDYVDLSNHISNFEGWNTGTISAWVKFSGSSNAIWTLSEKDKDNDYLNFVVGETTGSYTDESVVFNLYNNGDEKLGMFVREGHTAYTDSNWHHVVLSVGDGSNEIWVDGISKSITYRAGNSSTNEFSDLAVGDTVNIGRLFRSDGTYFNANGTIDEVRISNTARSAEWIKASYNNQFSPGTFVIEGTPETPGGAAVAPTSIFYGPLVGPFGGPI